MYHKFINNFPAIKSYFTGVDEVSNNPKNLPPIHETKPDTFEKTGSVEQKELEKLFPDNELSAIFDNIVKEYGLENPPELELVYNSEGSADIAYATHISNKIVLNLDNILSPDIYKFLTEKDGKKEYCKNENSKQLRIIKTDKQSEIDTITEYNKQLGADDCKAEKLSDDDKRKYVISVLAHELEHCYQIQVVRHTEGLDAFKMIETQLKNSSNKPKTNMLNEKIIFEELKRKYYANLKDDYTKKIYSKDSPQGQKAAEWYNASVNYTDFNKDYDTYIKNPLEVDANNRAHQYLTEHYGDFIFEVS